MKKLIGRPVKHKQYAMIFILFMLVIINLFYFMMVRNNNVLLILLISVLVSLFVLLYQLNLYEIVIQEKMIVVRNAFKKDKKKLLSDFSTIKNYLPLIGLFKIIFKDGSSYMFLVENEMIEKALLTGDYKIIETEIAQIINDLK